MTNQREPTLPRGTMTATQFAEMGGQDCPVCGTRVDVERVDVTPNAAYEWEHGRVYIAGRWACPRGCNPQTGRRYHGNVAYMANGLAEPVRATCTCGGEAWLTTGSEHEAWRLEHPEGQFS
jgi:hypothetical protein